MPLPKDRIHLSSRYLEFCDVGQPFLIWHPGLKISVDEILRRRADFSQIGPVPTPSIGGNDQAFLLHQASHDFLRDV